jgi:hypothetical protein
MGCKVPASPMLEYHTYREKMRSTGKKRRKKKKKK